MIIDVDQAREALRDLARRPPELPVGGWPAWATPRDYLRSPAARRVGHLAAAQGLFLFHYEYRVQMPLPEDWVPAHAPDLALPSGWAAGTLLERKYHGFRHDQANGGFNPGHRGKWTTHELCHALVGFGWRPEPTPFYLATAGRLAELLPVVLYYFLDEVHLRRCPLHADQWALYRSFCPDCEAVAACAADDPASRDKLRAAERYIDRELAAVTRSRRLGRPVPHIHGSLDLCSDGVAYAAAHGPRLQSEAFHRYAERFLVEGGGTCARLDELEHRVVAVTRAIAHGAPLDDLAPTPTHGRSRWVLQDLGWRLQCVWHETEGEAADVLDDLLERLGGAVALTASPDADIARIAAGAVDEVVAGYSALAEEWVLPEPGELFSLGYPLTTAFGAHAPFVAEGVESALPVTTALFGDAVLEQVAEMLDEGTPWERRALPLRYADHLRGRVDSAVADLAHYEAAVATLPPHDASFAALGPGADDRVRLSPAARVLEFGTDPVVLARDGAFGDLVLDGEGVLRDVDGDRPAAEPSALALVRDVRGEVQAAVLDMGTAEALMGLGDGAALVLEPGMREQLVELGVVVPMAWSDGESLEDTR